MDWNKSQKVIYPYTQIKVHEYKENLDYHIKMTRKNDYELSDSGDESVDYKKLKDKSDS